MNPAELDSLDSDTAASSGVVQSILNKFMATRKKPPSKRKPAASSVADVTQIEEDGLTDDDDDIPVEAPGVPQTMEVDSEDATSPPPQETSTAQVEPEDDAAPEEDQSADVLSTPAKQGTVSRVSPLAPPTRRGGARARVRAPATSGKRPKPHLAAAPRPVRVVGTLARRHRNTTTARAQIPPGSMRRLMERAGVVRIGKDADVPLRALVTVLLRQGLGGAQLMARHRYQKTVTKDDVDRAFAIRFGRVLYA